MTDLLYGEPMVEHPATEVIAAYLSDGLTPPDRARLEAHLAECRPCRQEVTSARRLLEPRSLRSSWSFTVPAAAAAIFVLALVGRGFFAPPVEEEIVRGSGQARDADAAAYIQVLSPADENIIADHPILFAWTGQIGRPLYRLTVTDGSGQPLWVRDTTDTTLTLPASVSLAPGRTYFWYVDALDSAGRSLTTGTRRFSIAP